MGSSAGQSAASLLVSEKMTEHLHMQKKRPLGCHVRLQPMSNLVCKFKANVVMVFYLWGSMMSPVFCISDFLHYKEKTK